MRRSPAALSSPGLSQSPGPKVGFLLEFQLPTLPLKRKSGERERSILSHSLDGRGPCSQCCRPEWQDFYRYFSCCHYLQPRLSKGSALPHPHDSKKGGTTLHFPTCIFLVFWPERWNFSRVLATSVPPLQFCGESASRPGRKQKQWETHPTHPPIQIASLGFHSLLNLPAFLCFSESPSNQSVHSLQLQSAGELGCSGLLSSWSCLPSNFTVTCWSSVSLDHLTLRSFCTPEPRRQPISTPTRRQCQGQRKPITNSYGTKTASAHFCPPLRCHHLFHTLKKCDRKETPNFPTSGTLSYSSPHSVSLQLLPSLPITPR